MPAATVARMSHVESPTAQQRPGATPSRARRAAAGPAPASRARRGCRRRSPARLARPSAATETVTCSAPAGRRDDPREPRGLDRRERLANPGNGLGRTFSRSNAAPAARSIVSVSASDSARPPAAATLPREPLPVHPDHRRDLLAGRRDAGRLERLDPAVDARGHRVDERAVEVEDQAVGAGERVGQAGTSVWNCGQGWGWSETTPCARMVPASCDFTRRGSAAPRDSTTVTARPALEEIP